MALPNRPGGEVHSGRPGGVAEPSALSKITGCAAAEQGGSGPHSDRWPYHDCIDRCALEQVCSRVQDRLHTTRVECPVPEPNYPVELSPPDIEPYRAGNT